MGLFSSKFKALETLATTKEEERTEEQLTAAQAELDRVNAGILLVPHADGITSTAQLDAHIDALEQRAVKAEKATQALQDRLTATQAELDRLKGEVPAGDQPDTPAAKKDTPRPGEQTPEAAEEAKLKAQVAGMEHVKLANRLLGQEA